jgi:hypothetical protein
MKLLLTTLHLINKDNNMIPEHFCIWLQGYVETVGAAPTDPQWQIIVDHLQSVFDKQTPDRSATKPMEVPPKPIFPPARFINEGGFFIPPVTCSTNPIIC